jgi:hypothetical protein
MSYGQELVVEHDLEGALAFRVRNFRDRTVSEDPLERGEYDLREPPLPVSAQLLSSLVAELLHEQNLFSHGGQPWDLVLAFFLSFIAGYSAHGQAHAGCP